MKAIIILSCLFLLSFAASASEPQAEKKPLSPRDIGSGEIIELKVVKVYSATEGDAIFRAYVVDWKGQEVIASDRLAVTDYKEGDTIPVMALKVKFKHGAYDKELLRFDVVAAPPK